MNKFALSYTGPQTKRGIELLDMLVKHPEAMFVEKDERLFEVTAETGFDQSIAEAPLWRAEPIAARKR